MGKKSRIKRLKRETMQKAKKKNTIDLSYSMMPNFAEGTSVEEIVELFSNFGKKHETEFEESISSLQQLLLTLDPVVLLSHLSNYSLFTVAGVNTEMTQKDPVLQHHVEILQALLLINEKSAYGGYQAPGMVFKDLKEIILKVNKAFHIRRLAAITSLSEEERYANEAIESIRVNTQAVRNWGYPQQIFKTIKELFEPLERDICEKIGITVNDLILIFEYIIEMTEEKHSDHDKRVRRMLKTTSIKDCSRVYHNSFSGLSTNPNDFARRASDLNWSLDNLKTALVFHSDLRLPGIYSFSLDSLTDSCGKHIENATLRQIFESMSLRFGELSGANVEHFFMGNPVWERPFIVLENENYFLPIPNLLYAFGLELIENLIRPYANLLKRYEERRAKYLEEKVTTMFENAIPSSKVYRGSMWEDPDTKQIFENDLLVIVDTTAIIVEAKSGKMTPPARRGASDSVKKKVNELIIEPAVQSDRFGNFLQQQNGEITLPTRSGTDNEIDLTLVEHFIRVTITLQEVGALTSHISELKNGKIIDKNMIIPPTMSITDLEIVFEILDTVATKMHYLLRRAELQEHMVIVGDEIDILAIYMDNGLNIGEKEFDRTYFLSWGNSYVFDPYFMQEFAKTKVKKPKIKLTSRWEKMLERTEQKGDKGWIEIARILLNTDYDSQVLFETNLKKIQYNVQRKWMQQNHKNAFLLVTGPEKRRNVIACEVYVMKTKDERNKQLQRRAVDAMSVAGTDRVVVIGFNTDRNDYPYSIIAYFKDRDQISENSE